MRYIDLILYLFWNWLGGVMGAIGLWMEKMALAHYVSSRIGARFALRKLDTSIFVTGYANGKTHELEFGVVWVDVSAERTRARLEAAGNKVFFFEELHTLRKKAVSQMEEEITYL